MAIKTSAMSVSTLRSSAPCSKLPSPQLTTRLLTLVAIVVVLIFQSVIVPTAEARYLPTRSNVDQLKRQEIKEILRLLLDLPEEQREQAAWNGPVMARSPMTDMYELNSIRATARHPTSGDLDGGETRAKRDTFHGKSSHKSS